MHGPRVVATLYALSAPLSPRCLEIDMIRREVQQRSPLYPTPFLPVALCLSFAISSLSATLYLSSFSSLSLYHSPLSLPVVLCLSFPHSLPVFLCLLHSACRPLSLFRYLTPRSFLALFLPVFPQPLDPYQQSSIVGGGGGGGGLNLTGGG